MRRLLLLAICFSLPASISFADITEIPLPGLTGAYPADPESATRSVALKLHQLPEMIHGASFRIAGTGTMGVAHCGQRGVADLWPMEYSAGMPGGMGDMWLAWHEPAYQTGEFMTTAVFQPLAGTASWDFLMDGEAEVSLTGAPALALTLCDPILLPAGTITEAVFILDADFPLSVRTSTWGRIKSLYR